MSDIKVSYSILLTEIKKLETAKINFEPFCNSFISDTTDVLKTMNSDFIEKLDSVLDNMKDNANASILKELDALIKETKNITLGFQEIDQNIMKGDLK